MLRSVASKYAPWLKDGVTTVMAGSVSTDGEFLCCRFCAARETQKLPDKLGAQLALLDRSPGCDFCGCECFRVTASGERLVALPRREKWAEWLYFQCPLGNGATLMVRRHVVELAGLLDENLCVYQD